MKKMMALAGTAVAALALVCVAAPASAQVAPSTTVTSTWNGGGTYTFNGTAANSSALNFSSVGNLANGSISFTNQANNPYNYGVSNSMAHVNASVGQGGVISSQINRTGSGAMYGPAGQSINGYAFSNDGTAELAMHSNVNYASMNDIGYGQTRTSNGNSLEAAGSAFQLNYSVDTGQAYNSAGILVSGSGNAALTLASSGVSANGFGMGQGQGIFTQGAFTGTGVGTVSTGGMATGNLFIANSGSTVYGTAANPASVATTINYATSGAQVQSWNFAIGGNAH